MSDLSRYDDWLTWLRERGESDPDIQVVFVGGSASSRERDGIVAAGAEVLGTDIPAGVERIRAALGHVVAR